MTGDQIYFIGVCVLYITLTTIAFLMRKELEDKGAVAIIITLASVTSWAGVLILLTLKLLTIGEEEIK